LVVCDDSLEELLSYDVVPRCCSPVESSFSDPLFPNDSLLPDFPLDSTPFFGQWDNLPTQHKPDAWIPDDQIQFEDWIWPDSEGDAIVSQPANEWNLAPPIFESIPSSCITEAALCLDNQSTPIKSIAPAFLCKPHGDPASKPYSPLSLIDWDDSPTPPSLMSSQSSEPLSSKRRLSEDGVDKVNKRPKTSQQARCQWEKCADVFDDFSQLR